MLKLGPVCSVKDVFDALSPIFWTNLEQFSVEYLSEPVFFLRNLDERSGQDQHP